MEMGMGYVLCFLTISFIMAQFNYTFPILGFWMILLNMLNLHTTVPYVLYCINFSIFLKNYDTMHSSIAHNELYFQF